MGGKHTIAGIVQARLGSSRLPGKVLLPLAPDGTVLLHCIIRRLQLCMQIGNVRLVTSDSASDDALMAAAADWGIPAARGPVDDIIGRLNKAIRTKDSIIVRIWGDCPFIDPSLIDTMLARFQAEGLDFMNVGGLEERTLPIGLDAEIYRADLLRCMDREVTDIRLREFPVEYVRRHPGLRVVAQQGPAAALSKLSLTVDYPDDLQAARAIYAALEGRTQPTHLETLLAVLAETPELLDLFSKKERNIEYKAYLQQLFEADNA